MKQLRRVLKDHKQVGAKLIPPFLSAVQNFEEVPHVKLVVPELLWLAALNEILGPHEGARVCLRIARAAAPFGPQLIMATCTAYTGLAPQNWSSITGSLGARDRELASSALSPISRLYPDFLLRALATERDCIPSGDEPDRQWLADLLSELFDKASAKAVAMMANATYIAFCTGKLKVPGESSLAEFPEIDKYPQTEKSRRVAALVRCFTNVLVGGTVTESSREWPRRFWNRGLELGPCIVEGGK